MRTVSRRLASGFNSRRGVGAAAVVALALSVVSVVAASPAAAASKPTVTVTVSGTQTYGGTPTYTYTSHASDNSTGYSISGTLSCSGAYSPTSSVASSPYAITSCTGLAAGPASSYDTKVSYVLQTVTVTRAPLTVTAPSPSKVYGAAVPTLTPTITGFVNGQNATILGAQPTCTSTASAGSDVGTYATSCSGGSADNYSFTYVAGTLTVTKAPLTITASSPSMTYGGPVPPISAGYSGFVNGDNQGQAVSPKPTCSTTATSSSPVGSYPTSCSGAGATNYTIAYVNGSVTIGAATLTVTAPSPSKVYGAPLPSLSPTYSGFVNGQGPANLTSGATCTTTATASSNVGTFPVTCSGAAIPNYNVVNVDGTLTVTRATVTVTAPTTSVVYGDAVPTLNPSYSGFVNGDSAAVLTSPATCSSDATSGSDVGDYPVTCTGAAATNYSFSYVPGKVSITKASMQLSVSGTQVYGGTPSYSYDGSVPGGVTVDGTLSCTTPGLAAASGVGNYPIGSCTGLSLSGTKAADYDLSLSYGSVHVSAAPLTVTAPSPAKTYGADLPDLTPSFTGLKNNDTVGASCVTTATKGSDVGAYAVTCSVASDANYAITTVDGTLTVTPASLSISSGGTKLYGAQVPSLTPVYTGLVNGDSAPHTPATCSTDATVSSQVGTYDVTCSGAADDNYTIGYVTGQFSVTRAPLTVVAPSPSKTYGAGLPTLEPTYVGLVNGDTAPATTAQCSTGATASSIVGAYAVTCSGAADGNYTIAYTDAALTVTPAALTVLAPSVDVTYGFTDMPLLAPTYVGLVNSDPAPATPAACVTAAGPGGHAGDYAVTCSGAADPNYDVTEVAGTFTIERALLTITANSKQITYGDPTPPLDATYAGFQYVDDVGSLDGALTCTTDAGLLHAGDHVITCAGQSSKDYDITYQTGLVTVAKKAITGDVGSDTIGYGDPVPNLPVTYPGLVDGDTAHELDLPTAGCTDLGSKPGAGPHTVTCPATATADYVVTYAAGTLTVTKAPLVIRADNASMTYGDPVPELTGKVVDGSPDDTVSGTIVCATDAGVLHAGTHDITCTGLTSDNYAIAYQAGTLTVGKAQLTGQVDSRTITYGDVAPALALGYSGFANGDTAASLDLPSACDAPAGTLHVGDYPVKCGEIDLRDYDVTVTGATLHVTPAPLTVQTGSHAITYGQGVPHFGVTYDGFVNGEDASALGGTLDCNAPTGVVPAGSYPVLCTGLTSGDYEITFKPGSLEITKAALLVAAKDASMTYGDPVPTLGADVTGYALQGGDASVTGTVTCTTDDATPHAGKHPITCTGLSSPNYDITYKDATLTVAPAQLTGTVNSETITYGDATPAFAPSYAGFVNGDTAASLAGTISCDTPSGKVHAGTYPVHCAGQSSSDYVITYVDGTLTVAAAALTGQTDSKSMTYGGPVPAFGVSYTGFVNGDDASALTGDLSCNTPTAPHAGTYQVKCTGPASDDYVITYVAGSLTVNKASVTGSFASKSMTYGDAVPAFPVTYSGLVGSDTVASVGLPGAACNTPTAPHVGSHTLTCPATTSADYVVDYTPGTLTVSPATATVTAPNATRLAGQANPTFTPSYSGFVNGDTASVLTTPATCSTTATVSSAPGTYPISCSGASAADYAFTYVDGTLTVKVNMQIKAFAQPINDPPGTAQSVVKGGSTVPVKFQITDPSGALLSDAAAQAIATACNAKLTYISVGGSVGAANETLSSDTPSTGLCFRYDTTAHQFIYNLSTKSMATGTWTIRATVTLADGSVISHDVNIGIR
jgi:hypothetical protein